LLLLAALPWLAVAATQGDALRTPECHEALAALQAQEERALADLDRQPDSARRDAWRKQLVAPRRRAAQACLKGSGEAPPPHQVALPPVSVPPIAPLPPTRSEPPARPATSAPVVPPLLTITTCDAGGCWASDGSRVNRVGGALVGPHGLCTEAAGVLSCR
jgi:hypothetical protein